MVVDGRVCGVRIVRGMRGSIAAGQPLDGAVGSAGSTGGAES